MTQIVDKPFLRMATEAHQSAHLRGTMWLDSSLSIGDRGTKSFLAQSPRIEVIYRSGMLSVVRDGSSTDTPSDLLGAIATVERLVQENAWTAVGGMTYDGMLALLGLSSRHTPLFPDLHFFVYDNVMQISSGESQSPSTQAGHPIPASTNRDDIRIIRKIDRHAYTEQIIEIKRRIFEGDIYQANVTHRFELLSAQHPFEVYQRLRTLSPAPYSAFMNFGDYQIMSSSPERMFLRDGDHISTGPIKGTIRREHDTGKDKQLAEALQQSDKDRAEHLMIVDLERNDLGKIAQIGTVSVPALFRPERYSKLIHLVSDVTAQLKKGTTLDSICAALLPGGSITGAPKRAAVEILDAIEESPRGYYTGCLGYLTPERADFSIAIRTLIHQNGLYHIHAGGGIVADSDPNQEYQELLLKAYNLFRSLGVEQSSMEV
jgi:anthranilate/para-aminobenzoate synthase component I